MKIAPVAGSYKVDDKPIGKCQKCGLTIHQRMMYCCPKSPCPSGLGSKGTL